MVMGRISADIGYEGVGPSVSSFAGNSGIQPQTALIYFRRHDIPRKTRPNARCGKSLSSNGQRQLRGSRPLTQGPLSRCSSLGCSRLANPIRVTARSQKPQPMPLGRESFGSRNQVGGTGHVKAENDGYGINHGNRWLRFSCASTLGTA